MSVLWGIILVLLAIAWVVTIWDIVQRHLGTKATAAWILIVVILPFVGTAAYWILRKPPADEAERRMQEAEEMRHGGARPPFDSTRIGS